jgi:hypothetical protein
VEKSGQLVGYGAIEQQGAASTSFRIYVVLAMVGEVEDLLFDRLMADLRQLGARRVWARVYTRNSSMWAFFFFKRFRETALAEFERLLGYITMEREIHALNTEINGLLLPPYLLELAEQERWQRPADMTALLKLTKSRDADFRFYGIESLTRDNQWDGFFKEPDTDPPITHIFGLASSSRAGHDITDVKWLDTDKAIMIALNWDEDAICLDYRLDPQNPRVVASYYDEVDAGYRWKIIAPDFQSFAELIGL